MAIRLFWHGAYQFIGDGVSSEYSFDLRVVNPQVDFVGSILPKDKPDHLYSVFVLAPFADPNTGRIPIVSAVLNGWVLTVVFVDPLPLYDIEIGQLASVNIVLGYNG